MLNEFFTQFSYFPWSYAILVITSFLVLIATIIYTRYTRSPTPKQHKPKQTTFDDEKEEISDDESSKIDLMKIHQTFKRLRSPEFQAKPKLSSRQLEEEKESESKSLAAIHELLRQRDDIFPGVTIDDLKDQLEHLYKIE